MSLHQLKADVLERDGGCVWPGCDYEITGTNPLQLAHLTHRGMGGSKHRNTEDNCVTLCRKDHDVFDGRMGLQFTICRTRTALDAYLRGLPSREKNHGSTQPRTDTTFGDGRSAFARILKSSSTGLSTVMSRLPSTSTTRTTKPQIIDRRTSKRQPPQSTFADITLQRSTTKPPGDVTEMATALRKSLLSLASTPPHLVVGGERWGIDSAQLEMDKRPSTAGASTAKGSPLCIWPECEQPGSLLNLEQRQRWSDRGCVTSDCHPTPPDAHLCPVHSNMILDGRQGVGKSRYELVSMLRTVCNL